MIFSKYGSGGADPHSSTSLMVLAFASSLRYQQRSRRDGEGAALCGSPSGQSGGNMTLSGSVHSHHASGSDGPVGMARAVAVDGAVTMSYRTPVLL